LIRRAITCCSVLCRDRYRNTCVPITLDSITGDCIITRANSLYKPRYLWYFEYFPRRVSKTRIANINTKTYISIFYTRKLLKCLWSKQVHISCTWNGLT
jgi:hypothetical protein